MKKYNLKSFAEFRLHESYLVEGNCMSEGMVAQLESMCEAMCSEMKMVHEDSTSNTSHTYHKEVNERLAKMMEMVESACANCSSEM